MDINLKLNNLTPGEFALLLPVMEKIQQMQDERLAAKTEMHKARAAAAEAWEANHVDTLQEVPKEEPKEEPKKEEPKPDMETIRALLNELKQRKGIEAVKELLARFGVRRVPDIPEDKYGEVLEAVSEEGADAT